MWKYFFGVFFLPSEVFAHLSTFVHGFEDPSLLFLPAAAQIILNVDSKNHRIRIRTTQTNDIYLRLYGPAQTKRCLRTETSHIRPADTHF